MLSGLIVFLPGSRTSAASAGLRASSFHQAKVNLFSVSRVVQQGTHTNQFLRLLITHLLRVPDCRVISGNAETPNAALGCLQSAGRALSSLRVPSCFFSDGEVFILVLRSSFQVRNVP